MYIDYSKLWKLLIDKGLSKTDLIQLTGLSSRVIAKLSKNETVTTDTVARICAAFDCDVGDIMECVSEEKMPLYSLYKKTGVCTEDNELYKTVKFSAGEHKYTVYESRKKAKKSTHIHCKEDGTVYWEELYSVTHRPISEETVFIKPKSKADETAIVLIMGKPGFISGLDENGFISSRGVLKNPSDIYVMSETAFKLFKGEN